MATSFFHFKSSIPFELNIDGEYISTVDNTNTHSIDILVTKPKIYVTYMPISTTLNLIPYTIILENLNLVSTTYKNIDIIPYPDNNYDIILKPFIVDSLQTNKIYSATHNNIHIEIYSSSNSHISICNNDKVAHSITIDKVLQKSYSEIKHNSLVIESETSANRIHLLILKLDSLEIIYNDIVDSIKDSDTTLKIITKTNDLVGHGTIHTINLENHTIDNNLIYTCNNTPKNITHKSLLPLALLEAIKVNNINLAKTYLHDGLSNVKDSYFSSYFGNIDKIYYNSHNTSTYIENYTILIDNTYKNYNFMIENNKIKDIEQVF